MPHSSRGVAFMGFSECIHRICFRRRPDTDLHFLTAVFWLLVIDEKVLDMNGHGSLFPLSSCVHMVFASETACPIRRKKRQPWSTLNDSVLRRKRHRTAPSTLPFPSGLWGASLSQYTARAARVNRYSHYRLGSRCKLLRRNVQIMWDDNHRFFFAAAAHLPTPAFTQPGNSCE